MGAYLGNRINAAVRLTSNAVLTSLIISSEIFAPCQPRNRSRGINKQLLKLSASVSDLVIMYNCCVRGMHLECLQYVSPIMAL